MRDDIVPLSILCILTGALFLVAAGLGKMHAARQTVYPGSRNERPPAEAMDPRIAAALADEADTRTPLGDEAAMLDDILNNNARHGSGV